MTSRKSAAPININQQRKCWTKQAFPCKWSGVILKAQESHLAFSTEQTWNPSLQICRAKIKMK